MWLIERTIRLLAQLNLFKDAKTMRERDEQEIRSQMFSTRIYLILLITTLITIVLFTFLTHKTNTVTVSTPSLATYDDLEVAYADTLSCSCQQVAVPYENFLSIVPTYHQICSSGLVSHDWIVSLFNTETTRLTPLDFRLTAAAQFRLLALMCSFSAIKIKDQLSSFLKEQLITAEVLSRTMFHDQVDVLVKKFHAAMALSTKPDQSFQLISIIVAYSFIYSAFHTDGFEISVPGLNNYAITSAFYPLSDNAIYNSTTLQGFGACVLFNVVPYKAGIYAWASDTRPPSLMMNPQPPPVFVIPGMRVACRPYDALINATFECFFDSVCFNTTAKWISNLSDVALPKPLNSSMLSRFLLTTPIETIFEDLMVEEWNNITNYSGYYDTCAPIECSYKLVQGYTLIYIFTVIIGLFGGLTVALRIVTLIIVNIGFKIHSFFIKNNQSNTQNEELRSGWRAQLGKIIDFCRLKIVSLNLFEYDMNNERLGISATRIYLILLVMVTCILALYLSVTIHTYSITVSRPSLTTFEQLHNSYPVGLNCPCSKVTMSYNQIMVMSQPRFHPICTSMFWQPAWLSGYFTINFSNESYRRPMLHRDIRRDGQKIFYNFGTLCKLASSSFINAAAVFVGDEFTSAQVLSRAEFQARTDQLISAFKLAGSMDITATMQLIRLSIMASGVQSNRSFQALLVNGSWIGRRYLPAPIAPDVCACSVAYDCPDLQWKFYCDYGDNCTAGTSYSIPGMLMSCSDCEGIFSSDLSCFFNQTCFNTFLSMYNLDMSHRLPLPITITTISVLNSSAMTYFKPTDTIKTILDKNMVDHWEIYGNFNAYYEVCAPRTCTYTESQKMDIIYVVATVFGLLGGLSVTFRLFIPVAIQLIHWLIVRWKNRHTHVIQSELNTRETAWHNRCGFLWKSMKQAVIKMNFFLKETSISQMQNANEIAIISSRIYIIVLTLSLLVLVFLNSFNYTTISVTVESPSLALFEQLYNKYPTTLSCPCNQLSISYNTFILLVASYHQVCSSIFVNTTWTTPLYGYGSTVNSYTQLHRPLLSRQHQIMSWLCSTTQSFVDRSVYNFNTTMLVSAVALSRDSFTSQVDEIIGDFINQVPTYFRRMLAFFTEILQGSLLPTAFNTDFSLEFGTASNGYRLRSVPHVFSNSTCNCVTSGDCQEPLRIGPANLILPGLVVGCWPINGLRMSTLECFFNSSCINTIIGYLGYYTQLDGSSPNNFNLPQILTVFANPLNDSIPSRFQTDTPIGTLIDALFIEHWTNTSEYEKYFATCSPTICHYEYIQRNNALYVITSLLSLYGGLTISLKFIIWHTLKLYWKIKFHRQARRNLVDSSTLTRHDVDIQSIE